MNRQLNLVTGNKPKMLTGLTKNSTVGGLNIFPLFSEDNQLIGVKPAPKLPSSRKRNRVSPSLRPSWAGQPQGRLMVLRVWEVRESKRRPVIERIGIEGIQHHPTRKGADF